MSNLSPADKQYLENALRLDQGGIVRFDEKDFVEFFSELGVNIEDSKYLVNGTSQTERMRTFWKIDNNQTVGRVIMELAGLFRNVELRGFLNVKFSVEIEKIGRKLIDLSDLTIKKDQKRNIRQQINVQLHPEIYQHIKGYLNNKEYFTAVEEAYKLVRKKLKLLTGRERATDAFARENYKQIFGHVPNDAQERDFFDGVKYLHIALQFFRNEKVHTPAQPLDENRTMQYLALANLAYVLISENKE